MKPQQLLLPIFLFFIAQTLNAQTFKAGITAGVNWTQIDGDNIGGFTKPGLSAGVISEIPLAQNWGLAFEILYSQKGSTSFLTTSGYNFTLYYDYAEMPLLVKFHDPKGGLTFGAGASAGRLVRYKYTESKVDLTDIYFKDHKPNNWDWDYVLEGSYQFNDVWSAGIRWSKSMRSFRFDPNSNFNGKQLHHLITLRTSFLFSTLFKK